MAKFCINCGAPLEEGMTTCSSCGSKKPVIESWTCTCGSVNTGKFCPECGKKKPTDGVCPECGKAVSGSRFCPSCGTKLTDQHITKGL